MYNYFVHYRGYFKDGISGHGRCKVRLETPITCMEQIEKIESFILKQSSTLSMVHVLGWQRFETEYREHIRNYR